mmetsp:Transcript_18113/g.56733  ORF Transcript_18113/g.56733 Transcript_18113/m.56733 type:complete len:206 (+) Transcript_18113:743-1360(+)
MAFLLLSMASGLRLPGLALLVFTEGALRLLLQATLELLLCAAPVLGLALLLLEPLSLQRVLLVEHRYLPAHLLEPAQGLGWQGGGLRPRRLGLCPAAAVLGLRAAGAQRAPAAAALGRGRMAQEPCAPLLQAQALHVLAEAPRALLELPGPLAVLCLVDMPGESLQYVRGSLARNRRRALGCCLATSGIGSQHASAICRAGQAGR